MRAKDRNETKRIAKRHRSAPKIVNAASIPDKGTDDAYGNPFLGLPREKLADNAVGPNEADAQFLDVKHFPIVSGTRRIPAGVGFALGDALGNLDVSLLGGGGASHKIDKDLIPGIGLLDGSVDLATQTTGSLGFGRVSGNLDGGRIQKKSIPSDAIHALHGSKITGKSSIPWSMIDVAHVVFTHRLNEELDRLWRRAEHTFQKKP